MRRGLTPSPRPAETFKILLVAGLRYPIVQPFVGGLESHTWSLAQGLRARGHSVVVAGATGSDPLVVDREFGVLPDAPAGTRADISNDTRIQAAETAAFSALFDDVRDGLLGSFDLVHNNSLHHLPVASARSLPIPLVTTLHTPQLPWAPGVLADGCAEQDFIAVSAATAAMWRPLIDARVVHNGVDGSIWRLGPGGPAAVWSGRIAPEKAPHLAIDIAHAAGLPLRLAGPIVDHGYFADAIAPRLDGQISYLGHLDRGALAELVAHSGVALVTPVWDEPFGMVVAEAMSCGTPVAALGRGGIPEIVDADSGRLLPAVSEHGLTAHQTRAAISAVGDCLALDRATVRRSVLARCGQAAMLEGYERVYAAAVSRWNEQ